MLASLRTCLIAATIGVAGMSPALPASYSVIYSFPPAQIDISEALGGVGLAAGPGGTLFGITSNYGSAGEGRLFELSPPAVGGTQWTETTLADFDARGANGKNPSALAIGPDGAVYVTTVEGAGIYGVVVKFSPPLAGQTKWTQTILYKFPVAAGIGLPVGQIYVNSGGVIFGTIGLTFGLDHQSGGAVYRLAPPSSGQGRYLFSLLHLFPAGSGPFTGLTLGADGAFYSADQAIWRLQPSTSGQGTPWSFETLIAHSSFLADDYVLPPVADRSLRLFGAATYGGRSGIPGNPKNGFIYRANPPAAGQAAWTFDRLYQFNDGADGVWPNGVLEGPNGVLYGTAASGFSQPRCPPHSSDPNGMYNCGVVFSLTPRAGVLPWKETVLHTFGSPPDGATPVSNLVRGTTTDGRLALFGATLYGGTHGLGTIYEVIP